MPSESGEEPVLRMADDVDRIAGRGRAGQAEVWQGFALGVDAEDGGVAGLVGGEYLLDGENLAIRRHHPDGIALPSLLSL